MAGWTTTDGDDSVLIAPFIEEESRVIRLIIASTACCTLQVILAFTIPFMVLGFVGVLGLAYNGVLVREVWMRRIDWLLYAVFAPIPVLVIEYTIYVLLAEALDADSYHLADEDDLERSSVPSHLCLCTKSPGTSPGMPS